MTKPFAGVRVLDFTQVFAGPYGSYQLALLGADVIKIERQGGDDMRRGPPNKEWAARNLGTGFMGINCNKRNLALDLTKPRSIEIVHRLAARADVVMENYRPGVMDKLGIGYAALSALNPKLIYCAVSGFGQNGPERTTAAYDGKIQAMSGIMSVTGHPETGPMRAGFAVCDAIGGMTAAFAVSSALYQRTHTGRGQLVDVAMLDAALSFLTTYVTDYTVGGHVQGQLGNRAQSRLPTADVFKCKGGHILLAVNNEKQFAALARAIGRPDLPALAHPLLYALLAWQASAGRLLAPAETPLEAVLWAVAWINLAAGYLASIVVGAVSALRRGQPGLALSALLMPLCWLLVSAAAYRALYQLAADPYRWEKTEHGVASP